MSDTTASKNVTNVIFSIPVSWLEGKVPHDAIMLGEMIMRRSEDDSPIDLRELRGWMQWEQSQFNSAMADAQTFGIVGMEEGRWVAYEYTGH